MRVTGVVPFAIALALAAGPVSAFDGAREGEPYGLYDWAEASRVVMVGTVTAVGSETLQVEVGEVLRGTVEAGRIAVTPSSVSTCTGPSPVLQVGEQAVFFVKGVEEGRLTLVSPGAVLNMRFAGPDAVIGVRRILEIIALPQREQRERAVIDLLGSKNKALHEAAKQFIFRHVVTAPDADRFAPQLIGKLSSPDPEVRVVAAQALLRARSAAATEALVRATRDPNVKVVCAASCGLADRADEEAINALLALFNHADPEVRIRACLDTDTHVRANVIRALLRATRDAIPRVRAMAATGLVYSIRESRGAAAVPRLKEMLSDPDAEVRGRAAMTLGETWDPALASIFLNRLGPRVLPEDEESCLITALASLHSLPEGDEIVRAALRSHVPRLAASMRQGHRAAPSAALLLVVAGTPEARSVLEDVAANHPDSEVRGHAATALQYWDTAR